MRGRNCGSLLMHREAACNMQLTSCSEYEFPNRGSINSSMASSSNNGRAYIDINEPKLKK